MTLAEQEGVEVVAEIIDEAEILRVIEETKPEFLIVAMDSANFGPPEREDLLRNHPEMKILALATDGNSFTVYTASDGRSSEIHEGSEQEILRVMRSQARMGAG